MPRIKLVHHVNIQITDRDRTREWYERVLGARFLDRGPALNKRQLQLRIGTAEMHFSEVDKPIFVPAVHFALEVDDWNGMLSHLDEEKIPYSRTTNSSIGRNIGGDDPYQGHREDNGEHYTYIHDPDGNMIELVYHPNGLETSEGEGIAVPDDPEGLRWRQKPGWVEAEYSNPSWQYVGTRS